ncbi:phosphonate ABC transporter ATP-binding protein [Pseudorhodoplanes sp.]|uniref:phosphonate ABC transporter ATP-binding protein n=1 Tax=Pseudorhodoplanes sp. TaxID=1934341 RepID=UPI00391C7802
MLELDAVTRRFGATVAVSDVSIKIRPGSFVGVIGRSGAGKSTLLRMINRLVDPSAGRIVFDGVDVTQFKGAQLKAWRARAAMIFQQFNLVPRLDVLTNVLLGSISRRPTLASLAGIFTETERAMAVEALERLDLMPYVFQRAGTLSGGQQQRVAIARALMQRPAILLADEPIASLDPRNAARVMDSLKRINGEDGITVLCNLHTIDAARQYSDRIVGMAHGRIVFDGRPAELTPAAMREIYQIGDQEADITEEITATTGWLRPAPELAAAPA